MEPKASKAFENIREVFKCIICWKSPSNACLCPGCSKLFCFSCIREWFADNEMQSNECPNCRKVVHISDMVKLRWFEEVDENLLKLSLTPRTTTMNDNEKDECQIHLSPYNFYCDTCKNFTCQKCRRDTDIACGHTVLPLESIHKTENEKVSEEIKFVTDNIKEIKENLLSFDNDILLLNKSRNEILTKLENAFEMERICIASQVDKKMEKLLEKKYLIKNNIEEMDHKFQELSVQFKTSSKSQLISQKAEIIEKCQKLKTKPMLVFGNESTELNSHLIPDFKSGTLVLRNFSKLRRKGRSIMSERLHDGLGSVWRLKVYPGGMKVGDPFMSACLVQNSGNKDVYDYAIELINANPAKSVRVEATHNFKDVAAEQYLFEVNKIASSGFLDRALDTVTIKFYVRPPSLIAKSRYLQISLENMQKENLVPYSNKIYTLKEFSTKNTKVMSETLEDDIGSTWALYIYPKGSNGNPLFLSVMLVMLQGTPGKYEYEIELLNMNVNKSIKHKSDADFKPLEQKGNDKFVRLDILHSEGYLRNDDLQFKFNVRPPCFKDKIKYLKDRITKMSTSVQHCGVVVWGDDQDDHEWGQDDLDEHNWGDEIMEEQENGWVDYLF